MFTSGVSRRRFLSGVAGAAATRLLLPSAAWAATGPARVALDVTTQTIEVNGKAAKVYRLADAAGGRGLIFTAGDSFYVRLNNKLDEPTAIHWHGLTPPSHQDGVPGLSQAPIPAGTSYDYDFRLTQSGTYWMHSHFNLAQTQKRMSAPLIIRAPEELRADEHEVVVILNDFTFRDPDEILAQLQGRARGETAQRGGMNMEAEARKGSAGGGSMIGMPGMSMSGKAMPGMSMPGMTQHETQMGQGSAMPMRHGTAQAPVDAGDTAKMDVNDIDFDAYLANNRTLADPEVVKVERNGRVRLRIINAADSTNFHIDLGALEGELIAVDGEPIVHVRGSRFPMAMAQRFDIRVSLPPGGGAFPVFAVREGDTIRTGIVLTTKGAVIERISDRDKNLSGDVDLSLEQKLRAHDPLPPRAADRVHEVVLGGDMASYVWTINGEVYGKNKPLPVALGERVELVMKNTTSMSHPMHLHGTPFQVVAINGQRFSGALRDTVIVPRQTTVTIAFDANNAGRWAFHCHNEYHQAAGMMTSVDYV